MRTLTLIITLLLAILTRAADVNDTTFIVKDRKIVVDVDKEKTNVQVYDLNGNKQTKTRELEFVDGSEVERVFVGSPFVPTTELQSISFRPHFPMVWMGWSRLGHKVFSERGGDLMSRRSGSFELGATPWSFAIPFDKAHTMGLVAAVQVAWLHQCFNKGYAATQRGDLIEMTPLATNAKGNNINYVEIRTPMLFSIQTESFVNAAIGFTPLVRTNASYKLTAVEGSGIQSMSDTYGLKRFGLNLSLLCSYGPIVLSADCGLTPVYKTTTGTKAYSTSANIGLDVLGLLRLVKNKKKK